MLINGYETLTALTVYIFFTMDNGLFTFQIRSTRPEDNEQISRLLYKELGETIFKRLARSHLIGKECWILKMLTTMFLVSMQFVCENVSMTLVSTIAFVFSWWICIRYIYLHYASKWYIPEIPNVHEFYQADSRKEMWVATQSGKIVGTIALNQVNEHIMEIMRVSVDSSFRGLGIGKALADFALAKSKEFGKKEVILSSSHVLHEAHGLYQKMGFKIYDVDKSNAMLDMFNFKYMLC